MHRRRTAGELTIEELEQVLITKRRQARAERMRRLQEIGRLPFGTALPREALIPGDGATGNARVRKQTRCAGRGRIRDRLLFVLEVGALAGLVAVLIISALNIQALNADYAQVRPMTLSPAATPFLADEEILPDVHVPPSRQRDLAVESIPVIVPIPTARPGAPTRIVIPTVGVDALVVEGDGWEQLKLGVGHRLNTANPGQVGNMVLSAHNDLYGETFRYLDRLNLGDEVIVYAGEQRYRYTVTTKRIVEPTEVSVLAPTVKPVVTLISCYPYRVDTQRIVVVAELQ